MVVGPREQLPLFQQSIRQICKSAIASSFNDLIRPKLFYVFENITNAAGKGTARVYRLACKGPFSPAERARAQHFQPRVLCHGGNFAGGQSQLTRISVPTWNEACCREGRQYKGSFSLHPLPAESSPQQAPGSLCACYRSLAVRLRLLPGSGAKAGNLLNSSARNTTKQLMAR